MRCEARCPSYESNFHELWLGRGGSEAGRGEKVARVTMCMWGCREDDATAASKTGIAPPGHGNRARGRGRTRCAAPSRLPRPSATQPPDRIHTQKCLQNDKATSPARIQPGSRSASPSREATDGRRDSRVWRRLGLREPPSGDGSAKNAKSRKRSRPPRVPCSGRVEESGLLPPCRVCRSCLRSRMRRRCGNGGRGGRRPHRQGRLDRRRGGQPRGRSMWG